jgi:steroid 5-alpha reductase family enzyme
MSWRRPTDPMVDLRWRAGGLLVFAVAAVVALIADARPALVAALLGLTTGWLLVVGVKWHALRKARNLQRASSRYRQPRQKEEPRG